MTATSLDRLDLVLRTMAATIVENTVYFAELDTTGPRGRQIIPWLRSRASQVLPPSEDR